MISSKNDVIGSDVGLEQSQHAWQYVTANYDVVQTLGEGSFGKVVKAIHKETGEVQAIKFIKDALFDAYEAKKLYREIHILRQLSKHKSNIYTIKLFDVIIPPKPPTGAQISPAHSNKFLFDDLFLVQEYFGCDIQKMIEKKDQHAITEEHVKIIVYNIICAI